MRHVLRLTILFAAMSMGGGAFASGDKDITSVVELFTSQGCSSCPPADKYLGELAGRDDLVALTFPVDYWDYLGWKDTLANPANARRQKVYAEKRKDRNIYTPQMIINGMIHVIGSKRRNVESAIDKTATIRADYHVPVKLEAKNDKLSISVGDAPSGMSGKPATIWLILFQKKVSVSIKRGENRGRNATYYNVVREMTPAGMWDGVALKVDLPKKDLMAQGYDGCAVLLQRNGGGAVLGAAKLENWQMAGKYFSN